MAPSSGGHIPERTCVGCRAISPASELVRLCAASGRVTVCPPRGAARAGRGAWIHPRMDCVNAAVKAKAFGRAFRRAVDVPAPAQLAADVTAVFSRRIPSYEQGEKT